MRGAFGRRALRVAVIAAAALGATAGVAVATDAITHGSSTVYNGCVNRANGELRVVTGAGDCRTSETAIQWGAAGAQGPQGVPGPAGPAGPAGPQGPTGDPGTNGTNGADGHDGVSVTSEPVAAGDSVCTAGGSRFTAAGGTVTYACNGQDGHDGSSAAAPSPVSASAAGEIIVNSTTYLSAFGPSISATLPSGSALVTITASITPTDGNCSFVGFRVDGGVASDVQSLSACTSGLQASAQYLVDVTPGTHTFALQYRNSGGPQAAFANRAITVQPLP